MSLALPAATRYVWQNSPSPSAPYTSWATAARVIQDAVDAAQTGDTVLVTNGVYATGGRAIAGTMTNRVAINNNKAITVKSVNGPDVTLIQGYQLPGTTNGDGAIRCVYLAPGATLSGFTLTNGATRTLAGAQERVGGGVYCAHSTSVVTNCVLVGNSAGWDGGGAYEGTLNNCILMDNSAGSGGGAYQAILNNCLITGNSANSGGGACFGTLNNCTLIGNTANYGGGAYASYNPTTLNNCIIYRNKAHSGPNYYGNCSFNHCCTTPLPANGVGNIDLDPQMASLSHLSAASPCVGAGSPTYSPGTDLDGEAWRNPPSIGCDEYSPGAVTGPLTVVLEVAFTNVAANYTVDCEALIKGRTIASAWDFGDGVVASNRPNASHAWNAPGDYPVVLRAWNESNPSGVSATVTVHVVEAVHYVSAGSSSPSGPFASWAAAASTIQEAVDAATVPGALVLVSNGVYATGGRAVHGAMTNRVAVDKPVRVESVNGPEVTLIVGWQVPEAIYGDAAVRCVYLADGAILSGFTLTNGATGTSGDIDKEQSAGGVFCEPGSAMVTNCVLTGNSAYWYGGGAYQGMLNNCKLLGNRAWSGGGAYEGTLSNCGLIDNWAGSYGGGTYFGTLNNCTLTGNLADSGWGGAYGGTLNNCILYYNTARFAVDNYSEGSTLNYCCTTPLPSSGVGNINLEPQLASGLHLSATSPCIGAGASTYVSGTDMDGDPWGSPPSIGCDEYQPETATGPLTVALEMAFANVAVGYSVDFKGLIDGLASASAWDFGDGMAVSNRPYASHAWNAPGDYAVVLRAWNDSNPDGVSATLAVHVVEPPVHYVAAGSTTATPPFGSWATAASTIQEAVDAATVPGSLVLVSNGVYATGGRAVYGTMTNRVTIDKAITVQSVNGPEFTIIEGWQVPGTTNGDGAIRCVFLADRALLSGFTLTNGATQTGYYYKEGSGGGVWCESVGSVVINCIIIGNSAKGFGGGVYDGTLDNCILNSNSAGSSGGGAYGGTLNNCTLTGNSAPSGGGAYLGILNNCTLTDNSADYGGGARGSTLYSCMLSGNSANNGGGTYGGILNNCVLTGNSASKGGGAYSDTLNNCTLTANSAASIGGGMYGGTLNNCIVYYNTASTAPNFNNSTFTHSCTTPLPAGVGNISAPPLFVNLAGGDLRLAFGSPCIDGGTNLSAIVTDDLDGHPRPLDGNGDGIAAFDMGAYEFLLLTADSNGDGIPDGWCHDHGLNPIDPDVATDDPDDDCHTTFQEWIAGTNPTNAQSCLKIESLTVPTPGGPEVSLLVLTSAGRLYTLQVCTNLGLNLWSSVSGQQGLPGNGQIMTFTDSGSTTISITPHFYRIVVQRP